jgi:UDP-N-acetylglucosamine--N-acetylmuramyl-(pentapeptide) pyrophosphoryl-undecaprenol N-acetylglucosamine transferase
VRSGALSVVFAGGGTGGHLYPAIAMADEVRRRQPGCRIVFVGTKKKIEARVVPMHGYDFRTIWISGFQRSLNADTILFPLKLLVALVQSFMILRNERPVVVVGTGGYVSGPVLYMATIMGIPTLIQEQNSYPGVTTRLLASRVREVHLSFERSAQFLRRTQNVRMTGNPVRTSLGSISASEGRSFFGLEENRTTVLVFGGSLGAHALNVALGKYLKGLVGIGAQVVWQTGSQDFGEAKVRVESDGLIGRVRVLEFIDRMEYAYGASSLAVCRSGATTIAELAAAGLPSVLVPYPHAAADHQTHNAKAMADAGAAEVLMENELAGLLQKLTRLLGNPDLLARMSQCARRMAKPAATTDLADAIIGLAGYRDAG